MSRARFALKSREMFRTIALTSIAAFVAATTISLAPPAHAQIGNIFSEPAPRPPGNIPRGGNQPQPDDEEEVPELPQGRLLPTPNRPLPGQKLPKGVPQSPATLQPGDEVVSEPPAQKIVNKKASFSGLDKITGRIINFDEDIGETVQFGALRVKTDACYTRPATEAANTDAFVEVDEITLQGEVKRIFSGWMYAASPGLHGVEHPIYDIWLTDCKVPDTTIVSAQPDAPKPASPPAQKRAPQRRTQKMSLGTRRSFTRGTPRGLFGRFDGSPFIIAEFVAHDSRLRYGSLNHVQ